MDLSMRLQTENDPFVGSLETNTPGLKAELEKATSVGNAGWRPADTQKMMSAQITGRLIKKPAPKAGHCWHCQRTRG